MPADLSAVSVLLLALLQERPMHPYEAFGTLEQRRDTRLVKVNVGAVYHGFDRLEREGLAVRVGVERNGRRPERTTYAITEAGREAMRQRIDELLRIPTPSYPLFPVALAEAENLPIPEATAALQHRLDRQAPEAERLDTVRNRLLREGLPRRHLLDLEYEIAMLVSEVEWLQGLLHDLARGEIPWPHLTPTTTSDAKDAAAPTPWSEP